jgi:hypothetical protein
VLTPPQQTPPSHTPSQPNLSVSNLNDDFRLESESAHRDPAEELRLRRDREREDLRKLIAQKRKEKNLRVKAQSGKEVVVSPVNDVSDVDSSFVPLDAHENCLVSEEPISRASPHTESMKSKDPFSQSSFFMYSQGERPESPVHAQESVPSEELLLEDQDEHQLNVQSPPDGPPDGPLEIPELKNDAQDAKGFSSDSDNESESESEDLEYDNLIQAMKNVIEHSSDQAEDLDEFEEEGEDSEGIQFEAIGEDEMLNLSWSSREQPDQFSSALDPPHPSAEEILSRAEDLFTEVPYREQTPNNESYDGASTGSWDDFSEPEDSPPAHALTVFGLPFPLGKTICNENGLNLECNTPASRMEALREYLENSLGTDRFIKVYRLLKSVGPKDDDDELLKSMESVVGVEGLHFMDAFFQLIHIEDKFESGEW